MRTTIISLILTLTIAVFLNGQDKKPLSPPMSTSGMVGDTEVTIDYNAPSKKGRTLWGELVPYDRVWRTGANSATKISFAENIKINGQEIAAGSYGIFTIPSEEEWTIIFNKEAEQWGSYNYDESKDALRVKAEPSDSEKDIETMTFSIKDDNIHFYWGQLTWSLSLSQ
jgi:small nuclear ribonucleoprotein (snRNP)-like protein